MLTQMLGRQCHQHRIGLECGLDVAGNGDGRIERHARQMKNVLAIVGQCARLLRPAGPERDIAAGAARHDGKRRTPGARAENSDPLNIRHLRNLQSTGKLVGRQTLNNRAPSPQPSPPAPGARERNGALFSPLPRVEAGEGRGEGGFA